MSRQYDQQFKDRLTMHMLVCDPISAGLIFDLRFYLEKALAELAELRAEKENQ